jgi:negative regulator of replication initiation
MSAEDELRTELKVTVQCLDLLKNVSPAIRARVVQKLYDALGGEGGGKPLSGKRSRVQELVESERFRSMKTAQERYRELLKFLAAHNDSDFTDAAKKQHGTRRRYFAPTKAEIEKSGTSTDPLQISEPNGWWADVNCSTDEKRSRIRAIMREMKFAEADCDLAANAVR